MIEMLKNWYNRRFPGNDGQQAKEADAHERHAIYFFSNLIAPLLVAIVLAYLLEWPVRLLNEKLKCPRLLATTLVIGTFTGLVFLVVLVLIPNLWTQMVNLLSDLPHMFNKFNEWLLSLPQRYPDLIDTKTVESIFGTVKEKILGLGESALKLSLASLMNLVTLGIYAFLVPLMVFFLLKDKRQLMDGVSRFLPRNRTLASAVWVEMQQQIANYIRGKLVEIFVVTAVTYVIFLIFGLNYPLLLAVAVGISVLVPYIGAVLVAIPVVLVAIFQFGDTSTFWYIVIAFVVSQLLDGNLLVPFLFSEAVNLHPLVIIIAVLIFGGLWGFWGVFFAIPLATLVKAVVNAWPSNETNG